jgi:hypothetical protein
MKAATINCTQTQGKHFHVSLETLEKKGARRKEEEGGGGGGVDKTEETDNTHGRLQRVHRPSGR